MTQRMRWTSAPAVVTAALAALALSAAAGAQPADLVVTNARIWTGDPAAPAATALAVRDGRFVYVGNDQGLSGLIGPGTARFDAGGRRILPGLTDTHVHIEGAAMSLGRLDLRGAKSREDLLRRVREYAMALPEGEWVLGRGWSAESWPDPTPPTPAEIDHATGGRPAILTRMDGHSLIASASAIALAGVTAQGPPDPPGGKIGRDATGAPTGAFYEQAMGIVTRHAPSPSLDRVRELTRRAVRALHEVGVTQVGAIDSREFVTTHLMALDRRGELPLRVGVSLAGGGDTVPGWRPILAWAAANPNPTPNVRILGFKGYMDGSLGSRTAWMLEPFSDDPGNSGFPLAMAGSGDLAELISLAAKMGLQPAVHAIGDRANRVVLDWFEAIPDADRRAVRPRVEHAQHVDPSDLPRFAELGVVPSMQPYHKADDGRYAEERIGPVRARSSYAFRALYDSGAELAFGSDWPVVSCDPFLGVAAAVTARTIAGETFVPEQSLSVEEALACYTTHAAFALHHEGDTGVVRPGALADFIVLDRDVLRIDPSQIERVRVDRTYVGGRLVFAREGE